MSNILVASLVLINLAILVLLCFAGWSVLRLYRNFVAFITPADEKSLSPAGQVADSIAGMVGRSVVAQAKATFMGMQSGDSRLSKAVEGSVATDLVGAQMPLAAGLLDSFPALRKTLKRNPAAGLMISAALQKLVGGAQPVGAAEGRPSNGDHPRFKLGG